MDLSILKFATNHTEKKLENYLNVLELTNYDKMTDSV